MKQLIIILIALSALILSLPQAHPTHENIYIITYKENITKENINQLTQLNVHIEQQYRIMPALALSIAHEAAELLKTQEQIESIELEDIYSISNPNKNQTSLLKQENATLCIIDTDIKDTAQALPPISAKKDFINSNAQQPFYNQHAEEIAKKITAPLNISKTGIVPQDFNLLSVRVCDSMGFCPTTKILAAMDWCLENKATVLSISLGGGENRSTFNSPALSKAINATLSQGIEIITAE